MSQESRERAQERSGTIEIAGDGRHQPRYHLTTDGRRIRIEEEVPLRSLNVPRSEQPPSRHASTVVTNPDTRPTVSIAYNTTRSTSNTIPASVGLGSSPQQYQLSTSSTDRHGSSATLGRGAHNPYALFPRDHAPSRSVQQDRATQDTEFRSRLSSLGRAFVTIDAGKYRDAETFIHENPEILNEDHSDFLKEALAALAAGKDAYAKACVQQALLMRECQDLSGSKRRAFFAALINRNKKALGDFLEDRDQVMASLREKVVTMERPVTQPSDLPGAMVPLNLGDSDRHRDDARPLNPGPGSQPPTAPSRLRSSFGAPRPAEVGRPGRNQGAFSDSVSNAPTYAGPDGSVERIDSRYKIPDQGHTFFTLGRVFAMLWHTGIGSSRTADKQHDRHNWVRKGRFEENIVSKIQRMAVVKEGHGCCWCIPVNTYNGRGVVKHGLTTSDRLAHAIIHMYDTEPFTPEWEPRMIKEPIAVRPAATDQKLDPMSRINFGKVHTVEHNIKVMNVGNITKESIGFFVDYWTKKTEEPLQLPQQKQRR